jgi:predicted porin
MQKKIIALAIAGLASSAVFAQSNVTVYGRVDYGYMSRGGGSGNVDVDGRKTEMASGMQAGSRIGFRGTEDLGNGLKAVFQLESGIANDAAASGVAGIWSGTHRNAYVGLAGNFGTVVGGRLDGVRYGIFNKYDAFAGGGMGNWTQMTGQVDRADNAIAWISPKWSGFGLVLAHSRDVGGNEVAGTQVLTGAPAAGTNANTGDGRLYTIMGSYDNGPWSATLDYETVRFSNSNAAAGGSADDLYVFTAALSYDFKFMKIAGLYDVHKADGSANFAAGNPVDYRDWFISASVPYGNFTFKATYGRINDKRNTAERALAGAATAQGDASKWGIGVNYALSKRTGVYADYGHINNRDGGNYNLSPAANAQQVGGYGTNGFNIGLAHNF